MLQVSTHWYSGGTSVSMLVEDMLRNKCYFQVQMSKCFTFYNHLWPIYWLSPVESILGLRKIWCSNNLKLEQKIRGKFGFETRTKTRKLNKNDAVVTRSSRGRQVIPSSLCFSHAQLLGQFSRDWFSEQQIYCFLSVLFIYVVRSSSKVSDFFLTQ
jgi:hypothetical protein